MDTKVSLLDRLRIAAVAKDKYTGKCLRLGTPSLALRVAAQFQGLWALAQYLVLDSAFHAKVPRAR